MPGNASQSDPDLRRLNSARFSRREIPARWSGITIDKSEKRAKLKRFEGSAPARNYLKQAAARRFLPFVREKFPALAARFEDYYGRSTYAPRAYDERLDALFAMLKAAARFRCGGVGPVS